MSSNFVLVQFGNQTRKIQGDPRRKKFNTLKRQIQDKFEIDADIDVQVFDRDNNQYFYIDSSEYGEVRNGGKIKVTKVKGSGGRGNKGTPKKAPRGSPMKPPGVPPPTKEDDALRTAWRKGSRVEIYSEKERRWIGGDITRIYNDREGEWLVIRFQAVSGNQPAKSKEIQRFSNYVRPVQSKRARKQRQDSPQREKKERKESPKREKRAPKVVKVTTQSKYKRQKRVPNKDEPVENQVEFRGNNGHIKQQIDRACMLLRGPKAVPEEEVKVDGAEEDEKEKPRGPWQPSQKWEVVHLVGNGRAMGHVVSAAEIIKRIVPGLHQEIKMETTTIVDVYEPTESGLKNVEVSRSVSGIRLILSRNAKDVDSAAAGYQVPTKHDDSFGQIEYKYPDEVKQRRNKKGKRRNNNGGAK